MQSKAYTEPSSSSSLFNLPYIKEIHYFSQARHIAHSTTKCRKFYLYYSKLQDISLCPVHYNILHTLYMITIVMYNVYNI